MGLVDFIDDGNSIENKILGIYLVFSSGADILLGTRPSGKAAFPVFLGFGCSDMSINFFKGEINLSEEMSNYTIPVTDNLFLRSLMSCFYCKRSIFGGEDISIYSQLFIDENYSNLFKPLRGSLLELKPVNNSYGKDCEIYKAKKDKINIFIKAESRLLLIYFATNKKSNGAREIRGYASSAIYLEKKRIALQS